MVVNPLIKDGKMFNIELIFNKIKISFRDSLLLLPSSLKSLAKSFNVDNKGIFPYDFVNNENLNYKGKVPLFKYFTGVSQIDYINYKKDFKNINWSLRDETIKYCNNDCIILYQIIAKFNTLIFEKFNVNIHRFPTLSSLALGIYRCNYLKDFKIPIISGKLFSDIRQTYTGGSTVMFLPNGKNIYAYDVNSLYPTVMKKEQMPVGNITYFEGDILASLGELDRANPPLGFFEVEITSPSENEIKHPIIQTKVDTGNGLHTLSPLGSWKDMLFSPEIYNAIKYGYKFKIIRGYIFESANIFADYIDGGFAPML